MYTGKSSSDTRVLSAEPQVALWLGQPRESSSLDPALHRAKVGSTHPIVSAYRSSRGMVGFAAARARIEDKDQVHVLRSL